MAGKRKFDIDAIKSRNMLLRKHRKMAGINRHRMELRYSKFVHASVERRRLEYLEGEKRYQLRLAEAAEAEMLKRRESEKAAKAAAKADARIGRRKVWLANYKKRNPDYQREYREMQRNNSIPKTLCLMIAASQIIKQEIHYG